MSENSDGGGGSQISALDDLLAGGIAGSASVIVGRELDLPFYVCYAVFAQRIKNCNV